MSEKRTPYYAAGTYLCRLMSHGFGESRKQKLPQITLKVQPEFLVQYRLNHAGDTVEENEATTQRYDRWIRIVVNPQDERSMDFAIRKLRHSGFTGSNLEDISELVNRHLICECRHDNEYGEQWDLKLPSLGGEAVENDPNVARRLNALLGKRLKEAPAPSRPPAVPVGAGASAVEDDDIPF